jgi:hypothetical protein
MTKWICNGCKEACRVELDKRYYTPTPCLLFATEKPRWGRDCTEERSSAVFDAFAGVDNRVCHLEKKVQELITAGQGQMKRIQELERELKNHYHDTGFPK